MLPFKPRISSLLLLTLLQTLVACTLPKPEPRDNSNLDVGTFLVDKSDITVNEATQHQEISLALAKTFNFKVCLKDKNFLKPIYDHRFEVTGGEDSTTRELTSDANGCINWLEKISYNHLAPAKWVEIVRNVKAVGFHQGQRQAHFAVNPWEDRGMSLLGNKIEQLISADKGAQTLKAEGESNNIWLDDMRLTISEKTPGRLLGLEIRGQVAFPMTKADGTKILEPITRGRFQAEFTLINVFTKEQKEIHNLIGQTEAVGAHVAGNFLVLDKEALMSLAPQSMCSYGQIVLGVRLVSQAKDLKLNPFEGIFANIGECDQMKGSFFSRLKIPLSTQTQGPQSIKDYVKSTTTIAAPAPTESNAANSGLPSSENGAIPTVQNSIIVRQPMEFTDLGYGGPDSYQREKYFSVTACMLNPIGHKPFPGQVFTIQKINGTTYKSDPSSENGCITWNDSVSFQFTDTEGWIKKSFKIQNELLKMDQTLFLDINPWKKGKGCVLDSRYEKSVPSMAGASQIVLFNFDYDMRDSKDQYEVDQMLDLKVRKTGILRLTAHLRRPSGQAIIGVDDNDTAPPGPYRLRWAIVDGSVTDFNKAAGQIYQADEKIVNLETGGTIAESLVLETENLKSVGGLSHILFEIEPLHNNQNLKRETFRGAMVLADRKIHENLEVLGWSQESLIQKLMVQLKADRAEHLKKRLELSSKEHLASQYNLTLLNLNDPKMAAFLEQKNLKMTVADLKAWVDSGKMPEDMMDRWCHHWLYGLLGSLRPNLRDNFDDYSLCRVQAREYQQNFLNPKTALNIEYPFFMKQVSRIGTPVVETYPVTVQQSFTLSFADDFTMTRSLDVNFGLNTSKWLNSPLSFGGGGRVQWAWSTKEGSSNSMSVQKNTPLTLDKVHVPLRAEAYEKCAILRLNQLGAPHWLQSRLRDESTAKNPEIQKMLNQGYMFCQGEVQKRGIVFSESYTILNQYMQSAQTTTPNSAQARRLFVAVRSERDHQKVLQALAGQMKIPTSSTSLFQSHYDQQLEILPAFMDPMLTFPGQFTSNQ